VRCSQENIKTLNSGYVSVAKPCNNWRFHSRDQEDQIGCKRYPLGSSVSRSQFICSIGLTKIRYIFSSSERALGQKMTLGVGLSYRCIV
jgi:hypothetical protein